MKGVERAEVHAAIVGSFNQKSLGRLLSEHFDYPLKNKIGNVSLEDAVDVVLDDFEDTGEDLYLIAAVAAVRPMKPEVQEVFRKYAQGLVSAVWSNQVKAAHVLAF